MALRYTTEVKHEGLGKYRVISGTDYALVQAKARAQLLEWERKHREVLAERREKERAVQEKQRAQANRDRKKEEAVEAREASRRELEEKLEDAEERTTEAQQAIERVRNILHTALKTRHAIDWEKLKKREPFSKPKPQQPVYLESPREPVPEDSAYRPKLPEEPVYRQYPPEPQQTGAKYKPALSLLDKLLKSRMKKKQEDAQASYHADHIAWQEALKQVDRENQLRGEAFQQAKLESQRLASELFNRDHAAWAESVSSMQVENERRYAQKVAEVEQWDREAQEYQEDLAKKDAAVDKRKADYEALRAEGVEDYCEMVLANSDYPDGFPQDFDLEYNPETKILIVEYALPAPDQLPRLKEVKYIKSKNEFAEVYLSETEMNRLYDDALYRICLRSLHELFEADAANALAAISFNGWVKSVDRATGKEVNACILTVQVKKEEFQARNLQNVDPKTCFKDLKGVGSSKLHSLTPVAPVLAISREDKRFIAPREVVDQLNEGVNLAAMDWEDFEHLIRELFEQEFKQAGGEVKITQASRDHGVDAVAFDPDVIRGGKTVIQAKRYTNTVGVSAVRDLYGTVLNEGASKGILVTTSDYGPDSYEFAKGKPLVLLSGANLLNLLEKHGHKAKIDLKEAKIILGEHV
jgi:restriction system protein